MIRTAQNSSDLSEYLKRYKYQPELTARLDALPDEPFSQETINEIVLWTVNRYVQNPKRIRDSLHGLHTLSPAEHHRGEAAEHEAS
jgi:hypothetical protein